MPGMARGRWSSEDGRAVVGLGALVLFGPYLLANYSPTWGFVLIGMLVVAAVALFWPSRSTSTLNAWAHEHPLLLGGLLVFLGGETVMGLVAGVTSREEETRQEAVSARWREADERRRAEEEASDRREREEREQHERQRVVVERQAEARRTPDQRAALVAGLLTGDATDLEAKVCRARQILAPLTHDQLRLPGVRNAVRRLRAAERAALRQIREDARGGRMIMCCDGSSSPSCACGRASRRGCCSWHGGICGCEPLPSEIVCPAPR